MATPAPILTVGLTGGIASGKSTVARFLAELGAFVVDADRLAHEALEPDGAAYPEVVRQFGPGVLDADGRIDRAVLGRLVFGDTGAREALNRIVHPHVRREAAARFEACARERGIRVAVFDAALLVETGAHREFHRLIVVRCTRETQIRRIAARDAIERAQAEQRIGSQARLEDKLALADYVIDTETTLEATGLQTARVYAALLDDFARVFPQA